MEKVRLNHAERDTEEGLSEERLIQSLLQLEAATKEIGTEQDDQSAEQDEQQQHQSNIQVVQEGQGGQDDQNGKNDQDGQNDQDERQGGQDSEIRRIYGKPPNSPVLLLSQEQFEGFIRASQALQVENHVAHNTSSGHVLGAVDDEPIFWHYQQAGHATQMFFQQHEMLQPQLPGPPRAHGANTRPRRARQRVSSFWEQTLQTNITAHAQQQYYQGHAHDSHHAAFTPSRTMADPAFTMMGSQGSRAPQNAFVYPQTGFSTGYLDMEMPNLTLPLAANGDMAGMSYVDPMLLVHDGGQHHQVDLGGNADAS